MVVRCRLIEQNLFTDIGCHACRLEGTADRKAWIGPGNSRRDGFGFPDDPNQNGAVANREVIQTTAFFGRAP